MSLGPRSWARVAVSGPCSKLCCSAADAADAVRSSLVQQDEFQAEQIFDAIDVNGDGKLALEEFISIEHHADESVGRQKVDDDGCCTRTHDKLLHALLAFDPGTPRTNSLVLSMTGAGLGAFWKTAADTAATKVLYMEPSARQSAGSELDDEELDDEEEPAVACGGHTHGLQRQESSSINEDDAPPCAMESSLPGSTQRRGVLRRLYAINPNEEHIVRFCDDAERHFLHRAVELEAEVKALQHELRQVRLSTRQCQWPSTSFHRLPLTFRGLPLPRCASRRGRSCWQSRRT